MFPIHNSTTFFTLPQGGLHLQLQNSKFLRQHRQTGLCQAQQFMPVDRENTEIIIMSCLCRCSSWHLLQKKNVDLVESQNTAKHFSEKLLSLSTRYTKQDVVCQTGNKHTLLDTVPALTAFRCVYTQMQKWDGPVVSAVHSNKPPHLPRAIRREPCEPWVEADNSRLASHWCWQRTRQKRRVVLFSSDRGTIQSSSSHERGSIQRRKRRQGKKAADSRE